MLGISAYADLVQVEISVRSCSILPTTHGLIFLANEVKKEKMVAPRGISTVLNVSLRFTRRAINDHESKCLCYGIPLLSLSQKKPSKRNISA